MIIGLTGGIASGKSTIAAEFNKQGIDIIDTDKISRELVVPGSVALEAIIDRFGKKMLMEDGTLDRRQLREQIFTHPKDKIWLESLLHPAILQQVLDRQKLCHSPYSLIIIPLLAETFEQGRYSYLDRILVIDCPERLRIPRLAARDQITTMQAKNQIKQQATRQQRLKIANDIITNDLDEDHLKAQVMTLHHFYLDLIEQNR